MKPLNKEHELYASQKNYCIYKKEFKNINYQRVRDVAIIPANTAQLEPPPPPPPQIKLAGGGGDIPKIESLDGGGGGLGDCTNFLKYPANIFRNTENVLVS